MRKGKDPEPDPDLWIMNPDPDLGGPKTCGSCGGPQKIIQVPKWIWKKNSDKLIPKMWKLLKKMLNLKTINSLHLVVICNLTHLQDQDTKVPVKFIWKNSTGTWKNSCRILNHLKRRIQIRNKMIPDPKPAKDVRIRKKNQFGSTTC